MGEHADDLIDQMADEGWWVPQRPRRRMTAGELKAKKIIDDAEGIAAFRELGALLAPEKDEDK